jgi:hypothetical protein
MEVDRAGISIVGVEISGVAGLPQADKTRAARARQAKMPKTVLFIILLMVKGRSAGIRKVHTLGMMGVKDLRYAHSARLLRSGGNYYTKSSSAPCLNWTMDEDDYGF